MLLREGGVGVRGGRGYLHAGGPGVHAGVEDRDKHPSAVEVGEPGQEGRGTCLFLGEQPVEGERLFVTMGRHGAKKKKDDGNKACVCV